jgi:hypothetical protein
VATASASGSASVVDAVFGVVPGSIPSTRVAPFSATNTSVVTVGPPAPTVVWKGSTATATGSLVAPSVTVPATVPVAASISLS